MDKDRKVLIVTKSLIFLCREEIKAKWLLNDDFGLLEASTYYFSSVETKSFSSGLFQIEIENEVTRKVVKITPSRRII